MKSVNINVEDEQKAFLDTLDNYSGWVRDAIDQKRGLKEKSLVEYEIEAEELSTQLSLLDRKIINLIENKLEHKEDLKLSEIEELNTKLKAKEESDRAFKEEMSFLESYEEVRALTPEQLKDTSFMLDILERLMKDGHRVGLGQIRRYCAFKEQVGPNKV